MLSSDSFSDSLTWIKRNRVEAVCAYGYNRILKMSGYPYSLSKKDNCPNFIY